MTIKRTAFLGFCALLPVAAHATVEQQATMAESRVLLAARMDTQDRAKAVLQQAVNCIVGDKGRGYDAARVNPCSRFGNGLIPDSESTADKARFEEALNKIHAVMAQPDQATRNKDLRVIAAILGGDPIPDVNRPPQPPRAPTAAEIAAGVRAAPEPGATQAPVPNRVN